MNREIDLEKKEAFAGKMVAALNGAATVLMTSIGHRTGLFDTLAGMPPSRCEEIAVAAGLQERYVREWLGAMLASGVVEFHPETGCYYLPPEHAASLTRAAGPENMATVMQFIPILGAVEDRVVHCFHEGGGVPYSAYPRFHAVMAEESAQTVVAALVDKVLPVVPGLTARLEAGIDVLDVGCGSGRAVNELARTFPASRFTGYDFSEEAIDRARREAAAQGNANACFEVRDVTHLPEAASFDLITAFDAIHDQIRPDRVLAEIRRCLRPEGVFLMQDISGHSCHHENRDHPVGPFIYTISCLHCMTVSLSAGGAGLGAAWGEETAVRMVREAGFRDVEVHQLPHDPMNNWYVSRP